MRTVDFTSYVPYLSFYLFDIILDYTYFQQRLPPRAWHCSRIWVCCNLVSAGQYQATKFAFTPL